MKNVKLFCAMTMHIKTVEECCVFNGMAHSHNKLDHKCFIANYQGEYPEIQLEIRLNGSDGFADFFGITHIEGNNMMFCRDYRDTSESSGFVSGKDYYNQATALLRKKKCLNHLRRMENQAKAA